MKDRIGMNHLFKALYPGRWPTLGMVIFLLVLMIVGISALMRQARNRGERIELSTVLAPSALPFFIVAGLVWTLWRHWPN